MFESLLARARQALLARNFAEANQLLAGLQDAIDTDEHHEAVERFIDDLRSLEEANPMGFLDSMDLSGRTRVATVVDIPPDAFPTVVAPPPDPPSAFVFVQSAATEPVSLVEVPSGPVASPSPAPADVASPPPAPPRPPAAAGGLLEPGREPPQPSRSNPAPVEEPAPVSGAPTFRDPALDAFMQRGAAPAPQDPVPPPAAAEPRRVRTAGSTVRKGRLRPELLLGLGLLAAVILILEPWKWGGSKPATLARGHSEYPSLQFRESRLEPVTPEAVRARFSERKEPPKPEFTSDLADAAPKPVEPKPSIAPQGTSEAAVEAQAPRASRPRSTRSAPVLAANPVALPTAGAQTAQPLPRRGTRYFAAPSSETPIVGAVPAKPAVAALHLPVNTRLRATLQIGVTSTRPDAIVIAEVQKPVEVGGNVVVPRGALLRGRSSSDKERIYVQFTEVIIGQQRYPVVASAIDGDLPGLHAQRREATLEERQQARLAQGALGAAADIALGFAGGGLPGAVLGAGRGAVTETQQAQQYDTSVVLTVPARTPLEAVVLE